MSPALWVRAAMFTENISRSGVLVAWCGDGVRIPMPVLGQIVTVEIELPANHGFGQKCIHCQGAVTRIAGEASDGPRIALRVNYMDFRSFHDKLRVLEALQPMASSWMA
jgi:hypothetical protein